MMDSKESHAQNGKKMRKSIEFKKDKQQLPRIYIDIHITLNVAIGIIISIIISIIITSIISSIIIINNIYIHTF